MNASISPPAKPAFAERITGPRRPRIALMGEFSAGKSTLANLMIGADPLPVQVIATQLPPVWITYGSGPAAIIDLGGNETACDRHDLQSIAPEDTAFIRIQSEEEILQMCDVIDLPGISDPNMSADVWARILPFADGVVWCSPATQAWRQSEAAVWENVPPHIQEQSILLLTRGDLLVTERDRKKVLSRVAAETEGLFVHRRIMSLTQARDAGDDNAMWEASGAEAFVNDFMSIINVLTDRIAQGEISEPFEVIGLAKSQSPRAEIDTEPTPQNAQADRIVPRRPVVKSVRTRPESALEAQGETRLNPKFS